MNSEKPQPSPGETRQAMPSPQTPKKSGSGFGLGQIYSNVRRLTGLSPLEGAAPADGLPPTDKDWRYGNAREINRGGMGAIYRVFDRALERELAMKVARSHIANDPASSINFVREARITAQLEHPNIVPVHDFGQTPASASFYTMKLVKGDPMTQILSRLRNGDPATRQQFDTYQRLLIFHKLCNAVAFAHAQGVVHRDIKPENIMVGAFGEVLLMDWGIAKRLGDEDTESTETAPTLMADGTSVGIVKGTPAYMSPEQALGRNDEVDKLTDVFLLGATLYHFLTLYQPYSGSTAEEVVDKAGRADLVPPDLRNPREQIPEELCRIILLAMAPAKANRYQSVTQLIADLENFLAGRVRRQQRSFRTGEALMRTGEPGLEGYVILSGQVEVIRQTPEGRHRLGLLGPGDVVGEMAVLSSEARSADVIAITDVDVEIVTAAVIEAEMRKLAPWMGKTVNALVDRLRQANDNVHPLMVGDCLMHVARQIRLLLPLGMAAESSVLVAEIARSLAMPPARIEETLERLRSLAILKDVDGGRSVTITDSTRLLAVAQWLPQREP